MQSQAAASVLLGNNAPQGLIPQYRSILAENETGDRSTLNTLQQQQTNAFQQFDLKGAISVLSDKTKTLEEKQQVVRNLKNDTLKDTRMNLLTSSIVEDSKGEKPEQMVSRATLADAVSEIYTSMNALQGIRNAMVSKMNPVSGKTVGELAETWVMPFGNSILTAKQAKSLAESSGKEFSVLDYIKAFVLPGSETRSQYESLQNLPPAKQVEFAKQLRDMIQNNSDIIFFTDNQFAQYDKITQILESGGYGSGQEFLDNISPLLDVIGLGVSARGASKAIKGASKLAPEVPKAYEGGLKAALKQEPKAPAKATNIFEPTPLSTPDQTIAKRAKQIDIFEAERAQLLGDSSGLLEPGQVRNINNELAALKSDIPEVKTLAKELQSTQKLSYKEALKEAEKRVNDLQAQSEQTVTRLTGMLEANAQAEKNEQRLAELDRKIAELKKGMPDAPGSVVNPITDAIRSMELNSVTHVDQPASVLSLMHNSNPGKARNLYAAIVNDASDEAAKALAGTTRVEAIASSVVPKIGTESGRILTKTLNIEKGLSEASEITNNLDGMLAHSGRIDITDAEKEAAKAKVKNDFQSASGLDLNEGMSTFSLDGGHIKISAVYGVGDSGFLKADDIGDGAEEIFAQALVQGGADAVDVPGGEFHRRMS